MRAIAITEWGGRDRLAEHDLPAPPLAPDGVLVRVRAAGVNPVDAKIREGYMEPRFPVHFPLILGWDAAGVVEEVGAAVTLFRPGDEVFGYCRRHHLQFGTYAEYATVPEVFWAHMPEELDFAHAGAMPCSALTAHQALDIAGVRAGETVFISGGSGGVGHFAVQLAAARGARVFATSSPANHAFIESLGAEPFDYADPDLVARVRARAGNGGLDAAIDLFGGDVREQAIAVLRRGGRLATVAQPPPEPREDVEVHYVFCRPSGDELTWLAHLVGEGKLRIELAEAFPLERAADAHERIEGGHVRGKLVLSVP